MNSWPIMPKTSGSYQFKTKPFAKQMEALRKSVNLPGFALFMEQGTGKTKVLIDTAAYQYEKGNITGMIILADNGIHENWITDEFPRHMPDRIPVCALVWSSAKVGTNRFRAKMDTLIAHQGLAVIAMNIDAVITKKGADFLLALMKARKCIMIVDESTSIRTPGAKRTKACTHLGKLAPFRRIASGEPAPEKGPLDLFSQIRFCDPTILGHTSYYSYKYEYAVWEKGYAAGGRTFPKIAQDTQGNPRYQNVEQLRALIAPITFRATKDEMFDLPPKLYQKGRFDLAPSQRQIYDRLRDQFIIELTEAARDDEFPNLVTMAMTRQMRLQQIASGFMPASALDPDEDPGKLIELPDNARLDHFLRDLAIRPSNQQVIVWARFIYDRDVLMRALGKEAIRYDGQVNAEQRAKNKQAFQAGDVRYWIGSAKVGGKGLTLVSSNLMDYYTNDFPLEHRVQSEDRAHRHGQHHNVTIKDWMANETVDQRIVESLIMKKKIAHALKGVPVKEWI